MLPIVLFKIFIVTEAGRVISFFAILLGYIMFAIPAGIIGTGLSNITTLLARGHVNNILMPVSVIYKLRESVLAGVRELSSQTQLLSQLRTQDTRDTSYVEGNRG